MKALMVIFVYAYYIQGQEPQTIKVGYDTMSSCEISRQLVKENIEEGLKIKSGKITFLPTVNTFCVPMTDF